MSINSQIQYYSRQQIDKEKWDACIQSSVNSLIYGYAFYLDNMAANWDALVLNDYEAVMPLIWNRKWGIPYLYQPAFTQQLGIFSSTVSPEELAPVFIERLKHQFRFAEIFLNHRNAFVGLAPRTNFILLLHANYATISQGYSRDALSNIRRAEKFDLQYERMNDFHIAGAQYKKLYASRTRHIKDNDYSNFERLCSIAEKNNMLVARQVSNKQELLATALLLLDKNRLYLLQSATLPAGRAKEANYFLIDNIIKEFSGGSFILDFEGSDIPGIAHFYSNFGAVNQAYYFLRYNRLPWPLRLVKK
jgi:hypothetical protein